MKIKLLKKTLERLVPKILVFAGVISCSYSQTLIQDLNNKGKNFEIQASIEFQGEFYLAVNDPEFGTELFKTDGLSPAVRMTDINPGSGTSIVIKQETFVKTTNYLFFVAFNGTNTYLYRTDGTSSGTIQISSTIIAEANKNSYVVNDKVIFHGSSTPEGRELFVTDGTPAGTGIIEDYTAGSGNTFGVINKVLNSRLLMFGNFSNQSTLYSIEPTINTPYQTILDFNTIHTGARISSRGFSQADNGSIYFSVYIPSQDSTEIWKTDGTVFGTNYTGIKENKFIDIFSNNGSSLVYYKAFDGSINRINTTNNSLFTYTTDVRVTDINNTYTLNDQLYFVGDTVGSSERFLYRTQGSLIIKIDANGDNFNSPFNFKEFNSFLYFTAIDTLFNREIYRTGGLPSTTKKIIDLNGKPETSSLDVYYFHYSIFDNELFFPATDGSSIGFDLWKTDGTATGTINPIDNNPGTAGSNPYQTQYVSNVNKLFFASDFNATGQSNIYSVDFDATKIDTFYNDNFVNSLSAIKNTMTGFDNHLLFSARDEKIIPASVNEIPFVSDGNTITPKQIFPNLNVSESPTNFVRQVAAGNDIYYMGITDKNNTSRDQIYRINGYQNGYPHNPINNAFVKQNTKIFFFNANGKLYYQQSSDSELGTASANNPGTLLIDLSGTVPSNPRDFHDADDRFFFSAANTVLGDRDIYISDGTASGTYLLKDFNPSGSSFVDRTGNFVKSGNSYYFIANNGSRDLIYITDGTTANTDSLFAFPSGTRIDYMQKGVNGVYFAVNQGSGYEMWYTSGQGNTAKVTNSPVFDTITGITSWGSKYYFSGNETGRSFGIHEIIENTSILSPINKISTVDFDMIEYLSAYNGSLIFTGTEKLYGSELWKQCLPNDNFYAGLDAEICFGDSVLLQAQNAFGDSVKWNNTIENNTYASPSINLDFVATNKYGFGCLVNDTISVITTPLPNITATVSTDTLCLGDSTVFNATNADVYSWSDNIVTGTDYAPTTSGYFTVEGTDTTTGCSQKDSVFVKVNIPQGSLNFTDTGICSGDSVVLTVSNANSIVWNNGYIDGSFISPSITTTYTASITDINGCEKIDSVEVSVGDTANIFFDTLNHEFTTTATGNYQWFRNDSLLAGETSATHAPLVNGEYKVLVTNGACEDTSVSLGYYSASIDEGQLFNYKVYPNPSSGLFYVNTENPSSISVLSMEGKLIFSSNYSSYKHEVQLSSIDAGMYMVIIKIGELRAVERVIIN